MPKLRDWRTFIFPGGEPFLVGTVSEHPVIRSGKVVSSSAIKSVQGRNVETESGTKYELLEPSAYYLSALQRAGFVYGEGDVYVYVVEAQSDRDLMSFAAYEASRTPDTTGG